MVQSVLCAQRSLAVNVITWSPWSPAPGVQLKCIVAGFPATGDGGVRVAPAGTPAATSVTTSPESASLALTSNENGVPATAVSVDPHAGVGATNAGATLSGAQNRAQLLG